MVESIPVPGDIGDVVSISPVQAAEQSTNMRKNICFKVFFMILQDFQNCTLTLNPIVLVDGSMNESKLW